MATKRKGGQHEADRPNTTTKRCPEPTGADSNGQQQTQSRNGQYGRYGRGEFFIGPKQALQDLQDKRIGLVAFAILCDVRSKGINWQLRIREVRKRFGWGERAARTAMRQLTNAGWAQLEYERGKGGAILGSHYVIGKMPFTETAVTQASVNRSVREDGSEERNKKFSNENKRILANGAVYDDDASLSEASPEEQELIDIYTELLSDKFRRWMPVTQYTDALQEALARFADAPDDFEQLCRLTAMVCDKEPAAEGQWSRTDDEGSVGLPKPQRKHRGRNSVIDLIWNND